MKYRLSHFLILLVFPVISNAQTYAVGDTVDNYTFTDYVTGEDVDLYDLGKDGGVLVLEWFAWWCPYCADAAANVETGIVEYYEQRGGNPEGLVVKHITLNVQGNARAQSDSFIQKYGFTTVLKDYSRDFFSLFSPGGGQPLFVIINAEPNSPSAELWEVLYTRLNYFSNAAPDISALMRPIIDSVEAGAGETLTDILPEVGEPIDGWRFSDWLGWFHGKNFPYIYQRHLGYTYLSGPGGEGGIHLHTQAMGWLHTSSELFPFMYSISEDSWLYIDFPNGSIRIFDSDSMQWIPSQ